MKMLKGLLLMTMILGVFNLGFSGMVFEVNTEDETANLREKPSSSSKILARLEIDDEGDIVKKEGDWYYVKYGTKSGKSIYGYIHKSQIAVGEIYITDSKDGYVNVRNEEIPSSSILEKLPNGVKVIKYSQKDGWYYVKFPVKNGGALSEDYGYIHESQIKKAE